jgi:hypothetical protein
MFEDHHQWRLKLALPEDDYKTALRHKQTFHGSTLVGVLTKALRWLKKN